MGWRLSEKKGLLGGKILKQGLYIQSSVRELLDDARAIESINKDVGNKNTSLHTAAPRTLTATRVPRTLGLAQSQKCRMDGMAPGTIPR